MYRTELSRLVPDRFSDSWVICGSDSGARFDSAGGYYNSQAGSRRNKRSDWADLWQ